MTNQRTLRESFSLRGKGLHTGMEVNITCCPAPVHSGYTICRTDLPDYPVVAANATNVVATERGTVLSENGVQVSTVEHALAALYAAGIDNCRIRVDAPEFPILDGSAAIYMQKIRQAGIREQSAERIYYAPGHVIEYRDDLSDSYLLLLPSETFEIHTQIWFDSEVLSVQSAVMRDISDFQTEIASSRTFVFIKDIEYLLQKGLIKGGDLDNAIVIYDKPVSQRSFDQLADMMGIEQRDAKKLGYIMNTPLRYPNEPARHKILDVLGDIALTGRFIKGHLIAICPGHRVNNEFARLISADIRKNAGFSIETYAAAI